MSGASKNKRPAKFSSLKNRPLLNPQTRNANHSTLPGNVLEKALYCRRHCRNPAIQLCGQCLTAVVLMSSLSIAPAKRWDVPVAAVFGHQLA